MIRDARNVAVSLRVPPSGYYARSRGPPRIPDPFFAVKKGFLLSPSPSLSPSTPPLDLAPSTSFVSFQTPIVSSSLTLSPTAVLLFPHKPIAYRASILPSVNMNKLPFTRIGDFREKSIPVNRFGFDQQTDT